MKPFPLLATLLVVGSGTPLRAQAPSEASTSGPAPLSLVTVLDLAVRQHPLVEAARARVAAMRGSLLTARSLGNPILTYQVENAAFPGRSSPNGIDRETSTFATLPLEPLFQRSSRVRRAQEDVRVADAGLDLARRSVALDAARAFFRVAVAQAATAGTNDVRMRLAELAAYTSARVTEGATSEGDLIRVQVELDRAESALTMERVELARARGELLPYLGMDVAPPTALAALSIEVDTAGNPGSTVAAGGYAAPGALAPLADYVAHAREARPDLLAARARVASAREETSYQRTLMVRQLGATFGAKRIGAVNTMIAGISVPIPLFDQNRGEVQRASAERRAVELELAWLERQVAAQVAATYEAARLLREQHARIAAAAVGRAEEVRRIALAAYREGAGTLLQVIDASRTLAEIRLAHYRTLFAERESLLELNVVSGTELFSTPSNPSLSSPTPSGVVPDRTGARP
ncbi:TolC family protein [soil metagenome]